MVGYGTLGSWAVRKAADTPGMKVIGVVSRRAHEMGSKMKCGKRTYQVSQDIGDFDPDTALLCTESEHLFRLTPDVLGTCHTIDSFDMHSRMWEYSRLLNRAAKKSKRVALYGIGWDPGYFSWARLTFGDVMPKGMTLVDYGIELPKGGVSRGHSSELNRVIKGVELACSRTLPRTENGRNHREIFIALKPGADKIDVGRLMMEHPYFRDDLLHLHFVDAGAVRKEFTEEHSGRVRRKGATRKNIQNVAEFKLVLESNPAFTAQILINGARACGRMLKTFGPGAYNITQIPPAFFSATTPENIVRGII